VNLVDRSSRAESSFSIAEDNGHRHEDRASQPPDWVGAKIGVLVHARRDLRVRQLHQQCPAAAEKENVLAIHPARDRILCEQAG
jgi:hypothetical protein